MVPDDILKLSWQIQLAIGSGYMAYCISYTGIRTHHKTEDVIFKTIAFGLVTTLVLYIITVRTDLPSVAAAFVSALATLIAGLLWRRNGSDALFQILKWLNVTQSDDQPSTWASLLANPNFDTTQLAVELEDGTWLRCDDTSKFAGSPHGPAALGLSGDVALYLTHEDRPGKRSKLLKSVSDPIWGDRLTYIPASQIRQVTMRLKKRG